MSAGIHVSCLALSETPSFRHDRAVHRMAGKRRGHALARTVRGQREENAETTKLAGRCRNEMRRASAAATEHILSDSDGRSRGFSAAVSRVAVQRVAAG